LLVPLLQRAVDFISKGDFPDQQPLWNDVYVGKDE
jgi:hypothetical protein